uniref:Ig-like domain-containing protein n=1 Tax=Knipowitschia caucasica TaxID=637954 RepID=A0AAV2KMA8_KNICA
MTRRLLLCRVRVSPDQSQFFRGERLNLRCVDSTWKVWKMGAGIWRCCGDKWGAQSGPHCVLKILETKDSGQYRCQSKDNETSETSSITVTDKAVILQMTTLPVTSGQKVDLICRHHFDPGTTARFYRNTVALSGGSAGTLTLQRVALSDTGQYQCEMGGVRSESAHLQVLAVPSTPAAPPSSAPPPVTPKPSPASLPWFVIPVVIPVVGVVLLIVLVMLVVVLVRRCRCRCRCKKTKGSKAKRRKGRTPRPQNQKTTEYSKPHKKKKRTAPN